MPRFVLLYHDCPPNYERASHWDLLLECGDGLRTWAIEQLPREWQRAHARTVAKYPNCPSLAAENAVVAVQLGEHRLDYLKLEGRLSGNRGVVTRIAEGDYRNVNELPDCWRVAVSGEEITGTVTFSRSDRGSLRWILEVERAPIG